MGIWWVNLGAGYAAQVNASALWAPNHGRRETGELYDPRWHWELLSECEPGEFVILCDDQRIRGIAMVEGNAQLDQPPPPGLALQPSWHNRGWMLPIKIELFLEPLDRNMVANGLFLHYSEKSPFRRNQDGDLVGNQIYFAKIPEADSAEFFDRISNALIRQRPGAFETLLDAAFENVAEDNGANPETTREALIQARVGQGRFRTQLLARWNSQCCASGLSHIRLLRASHILPWSQSDNRQRLDEFNGLLLSAAYDAAFDAHLITLNDDGSWDYDPNFTAEQRGQAGLANIEENRVVGLTPNHSVYLAQHRRTALSRWNEDA